MIEIDPALLQCPVESVPDGGSDYRGPVCDANMFDDADPVGADVDGNHGEGRGGNVLFKSGHVQTVTPDNPEWAEAARKTSGGNPAVPPRILTHRITVAGWLFLGLVAAGAGTAWFRTRRRRA